MFVSPLLCIFVFLQAAFAHEKTVCDKSNVLKREKFIRDPFEVYCGSNEIHCDKMKAEIHKVGRELSSIVFFKRPIKINLTSNEEETSTAFTRVDTLEAVIEGIDHFVSIPQALARQLDDGDKISSSSQPFDMDISFNRMELGMWFSDREEYRLQINQIKTFSQIFLHELSHGMGFSSHWTEPEEKVIFPMIRSIKNTARFRPMSVYDTLLYYGNSRMIEYSRRFYEFENKPNSLTSTEITEKMVELSEEPWKIVTTPHSLRLKTKYGEIQVYTPETYRGSSSLSHFDLEECAGTPDELMLPSRVTPVNGTTSVKELMGQKLLWVLSEIGWPTILDPTMRKIEIIDCNNKDKLKSLTWDNQSISEESDSMGFSMKAYCNFIQWTEPKEENSSSETNNENSHQEKRNASTTLKTSISFLFIVLFVFF